ncbi:MAG: sugar phosphate isomerase/epimerase [Clostridia bacterium]|nr:sugar phosphate isomerase/epimerase [Clostridia bacterium]
MKIGAQMYSVHDFTKTLEGFSESLKKIADIGYTTVQVSGTCAYEPEWLRDELKKNGLTCDLTHVPFDRVIADPKKAVEDHKIFGCKYIGLGSMPGLWDSVNENSTSYWYTFKEKALPALEILKENGAYYMYHNHAKEYDLVEGMRAMDFLKDEFPADLMGFTLDTHWIVRGGEDPVEEFKRFKDRIPCVHYKDLIVMPDGEERFAPVGHGTLDFEKIIQTSLDLGVEFAFVEQDNSYGEDPFVNLKKSYDYLKSMGLK